MMCLLNSTNETANTNEAFCKVLKKRIRLFTIVIFIGIFTIALAFAAWFIDFLSADQWLLGLYTGVGTGLIGALP